MTATTGIVPIRPLHARRAPHAPSRHNACAAKQKRPVPRWTGRKRTPCLAAKRMARRYAGCACTRNRRRLAQGRHDSLRTKCKHKDPRYTLETRRRASFSLCALLYDLLPIILLFLLDTRVQTPEGHGDQSIPHSRPMRRARPTAPPSSARAAAPRWRPPRWRGCLRGRSPRRPYRPSSSRSGRCSWP